MAANPIWTPENIRILREMWVRGDSTTKIAAFFGVTKNVIVGKVNRLADFERRVSPVSAPRTPEQVALVEDMLRNGGSVKGVAKRAKVDTNYVRQVRNDLALPTWKQATRGRAYIPRNTPPTQDRFDSAASLFDDPDFAVEETPMPLVEMMLRATQAALPSAKILQFAHRKSTSCCWPIGEPGEKGFHFCDDPSLPGRPYCGDHCKIAYVRIRDRREDAA